MKTNYETLKNLHCEIHVKQDEEREVIDKKLSKHLYERKNWIETFINPLAKELQTYFPKRTIEIMGPFGVCSRTSIWLIEKSEEDAKDILIYGNNILSVTIIPINVNLGIFYFETGEKTNKFKIGTIGELNGMNNIVKEIESIEELVKHLQEENETKLLTN